MTKHVYMCTDGVKHAGDVVANQLPSDNSFKFVTVCGKEFREFVYSPAGISGLESITCLACRTKT